MYVHYAEVMVDTRLEATFASETDRLGHYNRSIHHSVRIWATAMGPLYPQCAAHRYTYLSTDPSHLHASPAEQIMDRNERNRDSSVLLPVSQWTLRKASERALTTLRYAFWSLPGIQPRATKRNVLIVLLGLLLLGVVLSLAPRAGVQRWFLLTTTW